MLKIKYKKSLATLTALAISATVFSPFAQAHAAEDKTIKEVLLPCKSTADRVTENSSS
ncbi:hypothetical protein [Bacillus licheniformis]|uniref:hypothetical protein n=1 Tax=Bacillus licheniformis TaxID=1402 RepID=UPI003BF72086